jgi:hypothetical protein
MRLWMYRILRISSTNSLSSCQADLVERTLYLLIEFSKTNTHHDSGVYTCIPLEDGVFGAVFGAVFKPLESTCITTLRNLPPKESPGQIPTCTVHHDLVASLLVCNNKPERAFVCESSESIEELCVTTSMLLIAEELGSLFRFNAFAIRSSSSTSSARAPSPP